MARHNCADCIHKDVCALWEIQNGIGDAECVYYRPTLTLQNEPLTLEQVEKLWAGCEYCEKHKINLVRIEMNYNDSPGSPKRLNPTRIPKFCPMCGRPFTDEAVEMAMERLNKLEETKK